MTTLCNLNPIAAFLWLGASAGIAMFCLNPVLLLLSLGGALFYYFLRNPECGLRAQLPLLLLLLISALVNPLFVHNGATVLFVLNHNPVTLEAFYYGLTLGVMIVAVLYWFRSFQQIMTSDKLLYIFGSVFPKLTLILAIALRYIPLLKQQTQKIRSAQKALGLFRDENGFARLKGEMRIFSVLVTWALENGIITADSMSARGYGIGRRTCFALFHFHKRDCIVCFLGLFMAAWVIAAIANGTLTCNYYPRFELPNPSMLGTTAYWAYGILAFFPGFLEMEEKIRWKALKSKI